MDRIHESCDLRRHILDVRRRTLGPDDPATLGSLENLANTLQRNGDLDEARVMYGNLLTKRTQLLAADHPDTQRTAELLSAIDEDFGVDP
jgi:hypothetical protein